MLYEKDEENMSGKNSQDEGNVEWIKVKKSGRK
jgi:hypothetical protein